MESDSQRQKNTWKRWGDVYVSHYSTYYWEVNPVSGGFQHDIRDKEVKENSEKKRRE